MSDILALVLAWAAGGLLGAIFFGGLLWTVRKGVSSRRPALWFCGSFLVRTGIVLAGFYLVSVGHWERLGACFVGFVMVQFATARLTQPSGPSPARQAREGSHAP